MFEPMPVGLSIVLTGSLGWLYNKMLIRVRLVQPQPTTGAKDLERFKFSRLDGMCKSADRKLDGQGLLFFFFLRQPTAPAKLATTTWGHGMRSSVKLGHGVCISGYLFRQRFFFSFLPPDPGFVANTCSKCRALSLAIIPNRSQPPEVHASNDELQRFLSLLLFCFCFLPSLISSFWDV